MANYRLNSLVGMKHTWSRHHIFAGTARDDYVRSARFSASKVESPTCWERVVTSTNKFETPKRYFRSSRHEERRCGRSQLLTVS